MVPGVMLVDEIARAARTAGGLGPLARVVNAKFLRPVLGDMAVSVRLRTVAEERVAYEARSGDEVVGSGTLEFAEPLSDG
jgi:hypothetical protein